MDEQPEHLAGEDYCVAHTHSRLQELRNNLPYAGMMLLGSAVLLVGLEKSLWGWVWAGLYLAYSIAGAFWIIIFLCPYCALFNTQRCPCGYGRIAAKLRSRQDPNLFRRKFRINIPVIVPVWLIPTIAGGIIVSRDFAWSLLILVILFVVNSFLVLPLVARIYGCGRCPQKETCPWMKLAKDS